MAEETAEKAEMTRKFLILIGKAGVILDPWDQSISSRFIDLAAGDNTLIVYMRAIAMRVKAEPTPNLGKCAELM